MKTSIIFILYFLGIISVVLLGIYLCALILFVFGNTEYPGEIVFLPKWIFLFCPLIFLGKTKIIQRLIDRFVDFFEKISNLLEEKINESIRKNF